MADFFCDHGAYGLTTNRLGLDAPVWGIPQEGDGTAMSAATASSTFSINLTGVTSNAGTFALFGSAAISVGASASGATLATQIAAAINASTVTTGNTAIFPGSPQIRNAFYARSVGAVLEVMCRIGSALTNTLGMVWAGTWTSAAPTAGTFSGGSGGCYGWFINPVALGVSGSIPYFSYGAWMHVPYAGSIPTQVDTAWHRTGGGASKVIDFTNAIDGLLVSHGAYGTNTVFDSNTKWTGDSAVGKLHLKITSPTHYRSVIFAPGYPALANTYSCVRRGNFEIEYFNEGFSGELTIGRPTTDRSEAYSFDGIKFTDSTNLANGVTGFFPFDGGYANPWARGSTCTFENVDYSVTNPRTLIKKIFRYGNSATSHGFFNSTFNFNIAGVSDPGVLIEFHSSNAARTDAQWVGCLFLGFASGYKPIGTIGVFKNSDAPLRVKFDNCSGLVMPSAYAGLPTHTDGNFRSLEQSLHQFIINNTANAAAPGLRIEDTRGVSEWLPDSPVSFPTLNAMSAITGGKYSIRLLWVQDAALSRARPYRSPELRQIINMEDGVRTLTVEMLIPSSVTKGVSAMFSYASTDGNTYAESAYVLTSSAAEWAGASGWAGYVAKKITLTTARPVRGLSEIVCNIVFSASPSIAVMYVFVDPEFAVD